jgi:hypothetical protein
MAVKTGTRGPDNIVGTSSADVIYGYDTKVSSPPTMAANLIVSGLDDPLFLTSAPGKSSHLFILEKTGRVKVHNTDTDQTLSTPFLDVSSQIAMSGEQGLLGLAFAPDYATSRKFYVYLSTKDQDVEIREYRASASNPLIADPTSMRLITKSISPPRPTIIVVDGSGSALMDTSMLPPGRSRQGKRAKPRQPIRQDPPVQREC